MTLSCLSYFIHFCLTSAVCLEICFKSNKNFMPETFHSRNSIRAVSCQMKTWAKNRFVGEVLDGLGHNILSRLPPSFFPSFKSLSLSSARAL